MSKCKECGCELAEGAKFCGECGARAPEPVAHKCPMCGTELVSGSKFCCGCGRNLSILDTPAAQDDIIRKMEKGMVDFRIEKLGFHKIKTLQLLKKELNCTAGDYYDGTCSWMVDPERAEILKHKFEAIGATVEIKTYSRKDIESMRLAAEEPEYSC